MIGSSNIHQIFPTISLCGHDSNVLPHLLLRLGMTILLAVENEIWMELIFHIEVFLEVQRQASISLSP